MTETVDSASDDRTTNNAVRHQYRVLTDLEKAQMVAIKDAGQALIHTIDTMRGQGSPRSHHIDDDYMLNIADQRAQEAVMWAVKHLTA